MRWWPFGRRARHREFEARFVPAAIPDFAGMSDDERGRLVESAADLSRRLRWEAAKGMELTPEVVSTVSAKAALLVLGRTTAEYRARTVVIHPSTVVLTTERAGPIRGTLTRGTRRLHGQADDSGLILLAWDVVRNGGRDGQWNYDVVLHEFAHSLDIADGLFNGTPFLSSVDQQELWAAVCTDRYEALRRGERTGVLRPYGASSTAEFFAVAVEALFDRPHELSHGEPELFSVLVDVLNVDPSKWSSP